MIFGRLLFEPLDLKYSTNRGSSIIALSKLELSQISPLLNEQPIRIASENSHPTKLASEKSHPVKRVL